MTVHSQGKEERKGFAAKFAELLNGPEPQDDAARAAIEKIAATERRINEIREDVKRGVRKREGRFRL